MDEVEDSSVVPHEYKVYGQRWLVLTVLCAQIFANNVSFPQYAPIMNIAQEYYQVDQSAIVSLSSCYYITYFALAQFSIKPLEIKMDLALIASSVITSLGQWLKYIGGRDYYCALIGFILIGIGQLVLGAAPVYISDQWFPQHERTIVTSIGAFFGQISGNVSLIYVAYRFQFANDPFLAMEQTNLIMAIASSSTVLAGILFLREKPPTPPSHSSVAEKHSMKESYKKVFSQATNVLDVFAVTMFTGAAWGYPVLITLMLIPYNYSQLTIANIGVVYQTTGTIGGILASIYVDRQIKLGTKPNYDILIKSFISLGYLAIIVQIFIIQYVGTVVIIIVSAFIGLGNNAFLPLAIQGFIEKLFPSSELVLITLLMQIGNFFGFFLNYTLSMSIFEKWGLQFLAVVLLPFYFYVMTFYQTKYTRYNYESIQVQYSLQA